MNCSFLIQFISEPDHIRKAVRADVQVLVFSVKGSYAGYKTTCAGLSCLLKKSFTCVCHAARSPSDGEY